MVKKIFFGVLVWSLFSCQSEPPTGENIDRSIYFPLTTELTNDYQVNTYIWRDNGESIDTTNYQLREIVSADFVTSSDRILHTIDQYTRYNSREEWNYQGRVTAGVTDGSVSRMEGNVELIKMELPVKVGNTWNPTKYFDPTITVDIGGQSVEYYKEWHSEYISDSEYYDVSDSITLSDVVHVEHANSENKVEKRFVMEYYAAHIGLVYQRIEVLDTQCFDDCAAQEWPFKASRGMIKVMKLIDSNNLN